MKHKLLTVAAGFLSFTGAMAQGEDDLRLLSVSPKTLPEQRLHPASFPGEAEVKCSVQDSCAIGLARGFVLGSDLISTATTPIVGPIQSPGSWLHFDGFVGYQFLSNVEKRFFANGYIGYRQVSLKVESDVGRTIDSKGFTFGVNYAQIIHEAYTQGVVFQGYQSTTSYSDENGLYDDHAHLEEARSVVKKFYKGMRPYPNLLVRFPADFEVINWKNSHIDLPNHLRGYARVEPFYYQTYLTFEDGYSWTEKNFGMRLAAMTSYESSDVDQAGRYAFLAGLGADFSTSEFEFDRGGKESAFEFPLPRRRPVAPFLELAGSYQF